MDKEETDETTMETIKSEINRIRSYSNIKSIVRIGPSLSPKMDLAENSLHNLCEFVKKKIAEIDNKKKK